MKQHFDDYKEQNPAEWSEEDVHITNILECIVGKNRPDEIFKIGNKQGISAYKICSWLKSLPKRFNLQPKQEWNDKDEKILNELLDYCNTENANWYNWLKSLRPSWKPSEEQMDALAEIQKKCKEYIEKEKRQQPNPPKNVPPIETIQK